MGGWMDVGGWMDMGGWMDGWCLVGLQLSTLVSKSHS